MTTEPNDIERRVWKALDERRGRGDAVGFDPLGEVLEGLNVRVSSDFVNGLARRSGSEGGELAVPASVTAFVAAIALQRPRRRVIDPWCQLGQFAAAVAQSAPEANVRGVTPRANLLRLLNHLDSQVEWTAGRADASPELLGTENDLVLCLPPFNAPLDGSRIAADGSGELATCLLERSCESLSSGGDALFVLSPASWARSKRAGWRDRLIASGFAVRACFWIPSRTFEPLTTIPAVLVHITRGEQGDLFVAELPADEPATRTIFENFAKRRQATDARLGRWLPLDEFQSLPHRLAQEKLHQLGRRAGKALRLGDIASVRDWSGGDSAPGAVLLPAEGSAARPAVIATAASDLMKGRFFAIEPREDAAVPEYLARYFSSELGQVARETASSGTAVPRLSRDALLEVPVYLLRIPAIVITHLGAS
jgi:hypothetical protein